MFVKRQFLEECYAKITEAAHCFEARRQEVGRGTQDVESGDVVLLALSSLTGSRISEP